MVAMRFHSGIAGAAQSLREVVAAAPTASSPSVVPMARTTATSRAPSVRTGPSSPAARCDRPPIERNDPDDPIDSTDPELPTDSTDPVEPIASSDPAEHNDSADSTEAAEPIDATEPADHAEPTDQRDRCIPPMNQFAGTRTSVGPVTGVGCAGTVARCWWGFTTVAAAVSTRPATSCRR